MRNPSNIYLDVYHTAPEPVGWQLSGTGVFTTTESFVFKLEQTLNFPVFNNRPTALQAFFINGRCIQMGEFTPDEIEIITAYYK